ncbi:hypothetical protein Q3G72_027057 [Acer saccharum]|nr:hypothetical protein Q3G72_027057 [Acer saccharum]
MHIYSWPISAKVAEYGWNKRRVSADYDQGPARVPVSEAAKLGTAAKYPQPDARDGQDSRLEFQEGGRKQDNRSFAGAVRKNLFGNAEMKIIRSDLSHNMSWFGSNKEEEWLMRSAVGELKEFYNLELVTKMLESRGFIFSSVYLGGKSIMWTFEMICERDGVIMNGLFWRECFSSMSGWKHSTSGLLRLKWVDVYGVPMDCWCHDFFRKLGGQVGETVWVEEDTRRRARLDKGRIMILAPMDSTISSVSKVKGKQGIFTVRMEEDPAQVSMDWVNQFLGLNPPKQGAVFPNAEKAEVSKDRDDGKRGVSVGTRVQGDKMAGRLDDNVMVRDKGPSQNILFEIGGAGKKKVTFDLLAPTSLDYSKSNVAGKEHRTVGIEKGKRIPKLKARSLWLPRCKGGVQIGRRRKLQISKEDSSTFGSGNWGRQGPNFFKGETSKGMDKVSKGPFNNILESDGPNPIPKNTPGIILRDGSYEIGEGILCSSQQNTQIQSQCSLEERESFVAETPVVCQGKGTEQGINICIDLRNGGFEISGSSVGTDGPKDLGPIGSNQGRARKSKSGRGLDAKIHSMKARKSKPMQPGISGGKRKCRKVIWNLDKEISNIIQKGVELGVNFNLRASCSSEEDGGKSKGDKWRFEEEVAKVIETGAALGVDFSGREAEILEYLSSRECEEEASFNG